MSREFNVIIERDAEGYYVGSVPSLNGCHTQAKSLDELVTRIRVETTKPSFETHTRQGYYAPLK